MIDLVSFFVFEAVIAAVMMAIVIGLLLAAPRPTLVLSEANYKLQAYNGLKTREEIGDLRKNALKNDASAIEQELSSYISISYDVVIYNRTTNLTAIPSVDAENLITLSYLLAGEPGNYTTREIKLYMWGFE